MDGKNRKILVVDDEADILKFLCFRLKRRGFQVVSAMDGKSALKVAAKELPDIIFLDIRLPEMDGDEVCSILKKDKRFKKTPIIFSTADATVSINELVEASKADGYLLKPFDDTELERMIRKQFQG